MGFVIALLARLGLSQRVARTLAPFAAAALAVALLAALWGAFQLWDWWDDRQAVERAEAAREAAAAVHREEAAEERVADAVRDAASEEELHDAIDRADAGAPPGALSPAAHALACERLRRIGRIPPACRPAGGDRGEAAPD